MKFFFSLTLTFVDKLCCDYHEYSSCFQPRFSLADTQKSPDKLSVTATATH